MYIHGLSSRAHIWVSTFEKPTFLTRFLVELIRTGLRLVLVLYITGHEHTKKTPNETEMGKPWLQTIMLQCLKSYLELWYYIRPLVLGEGQHLRAKRLLGDDAIEL